MKDFENTNWPIIITSFSHVYESYNFLSDWNVHWIDCSSLIGVDGMCDENGRESIQNLLLDYSFYGIHLLDNGNYHYLSFLWCSKIPFDFSLVLFDHHADMQEPMFEGLLSCGSWVKSLLDSNPHLRHVYMFGVDSNNAVSLEVYNQRITCEADLARPLGDFPLYLSIDLDVLSEDYIRTNWDQGKYSISQLVENLELLWKSNDILGVDLCGEDTNIFGNQLNQTTYRLLIEKLKSLSAV
jgi:hypothetical protein